LWRSRDIKYSRGIGRSRDTERSRGFKIRRVIHCVAAVCERGIKKKFGGVISVGKLGGGFGKPGKVGKKFKRVKGKLEGVGRKLEKVEKKFGKVKGKLERVERKLGEIGRKFGGVISVGGSDGGFEKLGKVKRKFGKIQGTNVMLDSFRVASICDVGVVIAINCQRRFRRHEVFGYVIEGLVRRL
jgi:hypothetical protein